MMVHLDGSLVPEEQAKVPVSDRGLLYGDGVFETMRVCGGRVFRLEAHLARLRDGLRVLGIELERNDEELSGAVGETLEANGLRDAAVRVTVTRGSGGTRLDTEACAAATVLVRATAFGGYPEELYERGLSAITVKGAVNRDSPLCGVKSLNRLEHILARRAAREAGVDEALLADGEGLVIEAAASNVFVVKGDTVYTPPVEAGALPGITRACVLEALAEGGVEVIEAGLTLADGGAKGFEEAFLTNSLMGVMALRRVDGVEVGRGVPGPVTASVRGAYAVL
ncbi:MAG: aminotransferase class IV [Candidatus Brocadiaceae bacterium]|jgi:branched-chain amino acid aminotransferase